MLNVLAEVERRAITTDGVGFLIAAPLENDIVLPTKDYLPVHVFYPTGHSGLLLMLLHPESLVKSDRTAIIPADVNPFNAWVADRHAYHICKFVKDPTGQTRRAAMLVCLFPSPTEHLIRLLRTCGNP